MTRTEGMISLISRTCEATYPAGGIVELKESKERPDKMATVTVKARGGLSNWLNLARGKDHAFLEDTHSTPWVLCIAKFARVEKPP